jgi:hypothetical protein
MREGNIGLRRKFSFQRQEFASMTTIKRLAIVTIAVVAAAPAFARPNSRSMTCEQTQRLIDRNGAIVLSTGSGTYDRFVATPEACSIGERAAETAIRTRDGECPVFHCKQVDIYGR